MSIFKFSAAIVLGALSFSLATPQAYAASPATRMFMENAMPNVDFLDRSSRLAMTNSRSPRVKDFAHGTAIDATNTVNALYDWSQAGKSQPTQVAANGEPPLQTGRSVAVDSPATADARLPRGQEDIDAMFGAEGKDFDDLYKTAQIDALTQVQSDYKDYIAKGDDPALKALAVKELPKITKRLAAAQKI